MKYMLLAWLILLLVLVGLEFYKMNNTKPTAGIAGDSGCIPIGSSYR